jgi:O-methyltransferase
MKHAVKTAFRWAATHNPTSTLLRPVARTFRYVWECQHPSFAEGLEHQDRLPVLKLIDAVQKERALLLSPQEAFQLFSAVRKTGKVIGDLAEVGVFQGATAKLVCEAKGDRTLHLFDTFEGLPEPSSFDNQAEFFRGRFAYELDAVQTYLSCYTNVYYHRGLFPDSVSAAVRETRFSFVNLDVDLYQSMLDCINFFYPRMSTGGIIIAHDYGHLISAGVRKAIDEFFADKPEPVIELCGSQCLVVKVQAQSTHV